MQPGFPPDDDPERMTKYAAAKASVEDEIGRQKNALMKVIFFSALAAGLPAGLAFSLFLLQESGKFPSLGTSDDPTAAEEMGTVIGLFLSLAGGCGLVVSLLQFGALCLRTRNKSRGG